MSGEEQQWGFRRSGRHPPPVPPDFYSFKRLKQSQVALFYEEWSSSGWQRHWQLANALRGQESENSQEALRVLDIILRQQMQPSKIFADVGGGVLGCPRVSIQAFRTAQDGLSLNIGPPLSLELGPKAKRMLKKFESERQVRQNQEYKITGLSEKRLQGAVDLRYSSESYHASMLEKPKRQHDFPIDAVALWCPWQRYTKALLPSKGLSWCEKSRQKPQERMQVLSNLGGLNSMLTCGEHSLFTSYGVESSSQLFLGMDVSHMALLVLITSTLRVHYKTVYRLFSFKAVALDFSYRASKCGMVFSESNSIKVLNIELDQIIEGTTRPTHYHVLLDEVGFSADELQELVHSLSYVYQRSTTAISVVAPNMHAHLAATQLEQWMKFEGSSDNIFKPAVVEVARKVVQLLFRSLPKLEEISVRSMFFL
nr:protein argonaute 4 [Ipomoea batatas]